jgi:hypothetical protein
LEPGTLVEDSENELVLPSLVAGKCMVISVHQHVGQSHNLKMGIKPLNRWKGLNIWEYPLEIKIPFMKKLRAD